MNDHPLYGLFTLFDSASKSTTASNRKKSLEKESQTETTTTTLSSPALVAAVLPPQELNLRAISSTPALSVISKSAKPSVCEVVSENIFVPDELAAESQQFPVVDGAGEDDDIHPDDSVSQISYVSESPSTTISASNKPSSALPSSAVSRASVSKASRSRAPRSSAGVPVPMASSVASHSSAALMPPPPPSQAGGKFGVPSVVAPSAQYTMLDPSAYTPSIIAQQATLNQLKEEYARQLRAANEEHIQKLRMANEETMKFYHLADAKRREADDSLSQAHKLHREIEKLETKLLDYKRSRSALRDENRMLRSSLSTVSGSSKASRSSIGAAPMAPPSFVSSPVSPPTTIVSANPPTVSAPSVCSRKSSSSRVSTKRPREEIEASDDAKSHVSKKSSVLKLVSVVNGGNGVESELLAVDGQGQ